MAYDERVEIARRRTIKEARETGGDKLAEAVQAGIGVEKQFADNIREMAKLALAEAKGNELALLLAKMAIVEALSMTFGEFGVDAMVSADKYNKRESNQLALLTTATKSVVNSMQLAWDNHQTKHSGVGDMIANARGE